MALAFTIASIMAIISNSAGAIGDLIRFKPFMENLKQVGVSESWATPFGILKAAGVIGIVLGLRGMPVVGTVAALGLSLFYIGAIVTHLRANDRAIGPATGYLVIAAATLVLSLLA